ncbi:MAG: DUF359 domain-containing protein [Haloarculaceae archaeon]
MPEVVVSLPADLRPELKEPMGRVYTDAADLLADAGDPIVAVGDVVTYHLLEAGRRPDVALVDERTERTAVDEEITAAIGGFDRDVAVENPPATLSAALLSALSEAVRGAGEASREGSTEAPTEATTLIDVDGEEDLATLPAILVAPEGACVVYGQPGEGMVLVQVDRAATERARDLLTRMDGDPRRLFAALGLS